jgi:hypothetical protein
MTTICASKQNAIYIPDNSVIASGVLKDPHIQIDAVSDPTMNFADKLSFWFIGFTWWKGIHVHNSRYLSLLLPGLMC